MTALADSYLLEIEFPTSALFGNAFILGADTYATTVTRTNLVVNPSFETNTTSWDSIVGGFTLGTSVLDTDILGSPATLTRVSTAQYAGLYCLEVTKGVGRTEAFIDCAATASNDYYASAYIKIPAGQESVTAGVRIQFLDSGGSALGSITAGTTSTITDASGWTRFSVTATAPSSTATARVYVGQQSGGTSGQKFLIDAVLLEQTSTLRPYFDGDESASWSGYVDTGLQWNSTAHASTSTGIFGLISSNNSGGSVLDGVQKLGGNVWEDVTADVVDISIERGRSRQLDSFDSGTLSFVLRNNSRLYDPTNTSSTYYGGIEPRRPVRFSANGNYLFYGWIDDWNIDYSIPTESRVSASCVDAFSIFASIELDEFTFTSGERSDQRLTTALALPEVGSTGVATSFEVGDSTMADDTVEAGTTLLDYLQRVNKSEQGYLFVKGDGTLRFRSRGTEYSGTIPIFQDTAPASSTEFKYMNVGVQFGTELLYNRVSVLNDGETVPVVADDLTSQSSYLVRTLTITDLILENNTQAADIANFLLGKYSRPEFRFDSVTVSLQGMTTAQQNALFALEPNDLVAVKRTYTTGTPLTVTKYGVIEGVSHNVTVTAHTVTFSLSSAQGSLRLDNTLFGVLDSNTLGA